MRIMQIWGHKHPPKKPKPPKYSPARFYLIPLLALAFAAAFVSFEHLSGEVKTHHFLARADLPGFSNWLSLLILPMLGILVALRATPMPVSPNSKLVSPNSKPPLAKLISASLAALLYGAALASSFYLGLEQVSGWLFIGLLFIALLVPVYRAEYIFGFVVGMTITFGSAIPLIIALALALISWVIRHAAAFIWAAIRHKRT